MNDAIALLHCCECRQLLSDPYELDCGHIYCTQCAHAETLICGLCERAPPLILTTPKSDQHGSLHRTQDLARDLTHRTPREQRIMKAVAALSQPSMLEREDESNHSVECETWDCRGSAVARCLSGCGRLCDFCQEIHKKDLFSQTHTVRSFLPEDEVAFMLEKECSKHNGAPWTSYCDGCKDSPLLCPECVYLDHTDIDGEIDPIKRQNHIHSSIEEAAHRIRLLSSELHSSVAHLIALVQEKIVEIQSQQEMIEAHFDSLRREVTTVAENCHTQINRALQAALDQIQGLQQQATKPITSLIHSLGRKHRALTHAAAIAHATQSPSLTAAELCVRAPDILSWLSPVIHLAADPRPIATVASHARPLITAVSALTFTPVQELRCFPMNRAAQLHTNSALIDGEETLCSFDALGSFSCLVVL
eukprot:TRINITY_DN12705_c0_g1_i1.p1 TRINITY_DN12705_c0_g1~~TRINITY_DN12705_c0_g1_i1.p1  ORF type:complete len:446 (+),score=81.01 TRINITY_DN12705_c0_g1_i1:80-1339(+)